MNQVDPGSFCSKNGQKWANMTILKLFAETNLSFMLETPFSRHFRHYSKLTLFQPGFFRVVKHRGVRVSNKNT